MFPGWSSIIGEIVSKSILQCCTAPSTQKATRPSQVTQLLYCTVRYCNIYLALHHEKNDYKDPYRSVSQSGRQRVVAR